MTVNKKIIVIAILMLLTSCLLACSKAEKPQTAKKAYGVFLGINGDQMQRLADYQKVVVEPTEFSAEQVDQLQKEGKEVYAYLNVGAIENYRDYYKNYEDLTLAVYQDWEDEKWVDVSSERWQQFIINDLAKKYADIGYDGFFLDNLDVYYHYQNEETFQGLVTILKAIKIDDMTLIINGADFFVQRCIEEDLSGLFDAVNQETVFTKINFDDETFSAQTASEKEHFLRYLSKVKADGLTVYLLEYGADKTLEKEIASYCQQNGFYYYNSSQLDLR